MGLLSTHLSTIVFLLSLRGRLHDKTEFGLLKKNKAHILQENTRHPKPMKMDFNREVIISWEKVFCQHLFFKETAHDFSTVLIGIHKNVIFCKVFRMAAHPVEE